MRGTVAGENYVYERDRLRAEIRAIGAAYLDPKTRADAHRREDVLLERFVRDRGWVGDEDAMLLVELLDMTRRKGFG